MASLFAQSLADAGATLESLRPLEAEVSRAAGLLRTALLGGRKLLACGNGGSDADAAHLVTEIACRFDGERDPFPAFHLGGSSATLSAVGNDYGFEQAYARGLASIANRGDVLVAFSTSGNSANVVAALEQARLRGVHSVAMLGRGGGRAAPLADIALVVDSSVTARIQEAHGFLLHALCEAIEPDLKASHRPNDGCSNPGQGHLPSADQPVGPHGMDARAPEARG